METRAKVVAFVLGSLMAVLAFASLWMVVGDFLEWME